MILKSLFLGGAIAALTAGAASASVLYDKGPIDGTISAWTLDYGFAVSNSFTLSSSATVTGVNFGAWTYPGDTLTAVDWAITTTPNAFPDSGTAAVTTGAITLNGYGYNLSTDSFSTGSVHLAAGTYYLVLQNAAIANGDLVGWDVNNGPSSAWESDVGSTANYFGEGSGSDSFQILGTSAPEPASWALMLLGVGAVGGSMRSRRKAASVR